MTKFLHVLAAGILLATGGHAQAQPAELENIVIPQSRVVPPRHGMPGPVVLSEVSISLNVLEQVATTTMTITLTNPARFQQEASLLVPVPAGAAVRQFQLEGLSDEGIARVLPRDEARRIYDQIVNRARDPGLVEWVGYNLIRTSVFPVPAGGVQRCSLTYEQVLPSDAGRIDYVLPRSQDLDARGVRWSYSAEVKSKRPLSTVYSPTHEITTERLDPRHIRVSVPAHAANAAGSFRLSYLVESDAGVTASLMAYPDAELGAESGYFLLLAGLPASRPEGVRVVPREVTVVLDRSGSMRGEKMEQAREAALQVIEGLNDGEAFNIIDYSDSIQSFAAAPVIKDKATMEAVREYIKGIRANGGTNIHDALVEALRQPPVVGHLPVVLFLTDGLPTVGERNERSIRENIRRINTHGRRIFTFGVGYDVNAPLLTHIAKSSRAVSEFVLPDEDVEVKVGQTFRRLSGPVLASPRLVALDAHGRETTRAMRELQPAELPDLFQGDQLVLLGQYTGREPLRIRLTGDYFGHERAFEFTLGTDKATTRHAFVPRLWASRKIAFLIDQIRQAGAPTGAPATSAASVPDARTKELIDEIIALSTRWGILTEYTSFLAVEPADFAGQPGGGGMRPRANSVRPDDAGRLAWGELDAKARQLRVGREGVSQEYNLKAQSEAECFVLGNRFLDDKMNTISITSVRQIADCTMFDRGGTWIDARLLARESDKPDRVVRFGSPEYSAIVERLVSEDRQAVLALSGRILFLFEGERVLVEPEAIP